MKVFGKREGGRRERRAFWYGRILRYARALIGMAAYYATPACFLVWPHITLRPRALSSQSFQIVQGGDESLCRAAAAAATSHERGVYMKASCKAVRVQPGVYASVTACMHACVCVR